RIPAVRVYVVAKGDTVYAIGRRFGVSPVRILRQNRIRGTKGGVYPGQKLILPKPSPGSKVWSAPSAPRQEYGAASARIDKPASPSTVEIKPLPPAKASTWPPARPSTKAAAVNPPSGRKVPASTRPPPRAGAFMWPLRGRLLSTFGAKGGGQINDGINIAGRAGDPVRATETGIVAYAGNELRGYGNLLLIRHSGGWVSAYAHNRKILVTKGQVVRRGQTVARVGRSGAVTRPQLHFELRRGPRAINPVPYLSKKG
ncbi:MAG: M23 family metallopeptidase, partial [Alphaproteobacteria bacterium]|nr:M23 family metallopeptidase [Alphaproteobacteria bacterium]